MLAPILGGWRKILKIYGWVDTKGRGRKFSIAEWGGGADQTCQLDFPGGVGTNEEAMEVNSWC